ncbi:ATP-binding cassette sub-family G member 1-like [Ischnura elegans]|uniref:ATP-binding cassette sub-family G member 1-like n=1 Tax=Ischnura elegans TaxID=197161 RepID=UPI001ED8798E|nr:ATP-binding cassette sub-family G member 1-like [Ischnura elegans]
MATQRGTAHAAAGEEVMSLSYLPTRQPVDIEFIDLSYSVPLGAKGYKLILRNISGAFRSGQLTAIIGPSGSGKSTLLNVLAGYKCGGATGCVTTNGSPRDLSKFRKLSRYIMQEDKLQSHVTVREALRTAADLKLGNLLSNLEKDRTVEEIIACLRLQRCSDTRTQNLSGGERKRLSIALELVDNPPVIFLDEPTTGLDDLSSAQCILLLQQLAKGGRTIICSLHTPSARLFATFDHVYLVADGQCAYTGPPHQIVPFLLRTLSLACPTTYNPADFVIEVSSGEYGDLTERMVIAVDNGRNRCWTEENTTNKITAPESKNADANVPGTEESRSKQANDVRIRRGKQNDYQFATSGWTQFRILLYRMLLQSFRDSNYLLLRFTMHVALGLLIGGLFYDVGNDGAKTIVNFGFCYTCIIFFLYIPLMPILLEFPKEVQLLKREHFNRWYGLNAYFCAFTIARLPTQLFLGLLYISIVYLLSGQPLEFVRCTQFVLICLMVSIVSESLGLIIASVLNIVNGMFVGPTLSVPLMLLAAYGCGTTGTSHVPLLIRLLMRLSYLRYGLEGIIASVYAGDPPRPLLPCRPPADYCHLREANSIMRTVGMEGVNFWVALASLVATFILFRAASYALLRWRLCGAGRAFSGARSPLTTLNLVGRFVKTRFNLSSHSGTRGMRLGLGGP